MIRLSNYVKLLMYESEMPIDKASQIFSSFGISNAENMSPEELRKAYIKLIKSIHPDKESGNSENAKSLNAAYDSLKNKKSIPSLISFPTKDINYYTNKAWEISGRPAKENKNKYTIYNWDGYYFRGSFSVYTTPKHWFEVSKLMIEWDKDYRSVAVFVCSAHPSDKTIYLVNHHGNKIDPPIKYEHNSFNNNPGNDIKLTDKLRKKL